MSVGEIELDSEDHGHSFKKETWSGRACADRFLAGHSPLPGKPSERQRLFLAIKKRGAPETLQSLVGRYSLCTTSRSFRKLNGRHWRLRRISNSLQFATLNGEFISKRGSFPVESQSQSSTHSLEPKGARSTFCRRMRRFGRETARACRRAFGGETRVIGNQRRKISNDALWQQQLTRQCTPQGRFRAPADKFSLIEARGARGRAETRGPLEQTRKRTLDQQVGKLPDTRITNEL